jgi:flavin-dependent dehydrogenase
MYDVVIIGAGVSGSACARELSKYNLSICVVEKEECAVAPQRPTVLLSIPELTVRPVHLWHR